MELLKLFEQIRSPLLDTVLSALTYLGAEVVFMGVAMLFFWCIDKRKGYYLLSLGFLGSVVNQFAKLMFRIPRPWVLDKDFTIVESAREGAGGYSFPSGHTQIATTTFGGVARFAKKLWVRIALIAVVLLVGFSRMYLGVHTLLDVGVSLLFGTLLVFAFYPIFKLSERKPSVLYVFFSVLLAIGAAFVLFVELWQPPVGMDAENLASGMKNAYTMLGTSAGVLLVFILDTNFIHFETKAVWWAQLLKIIGGMGVAMLVRTLLKAPLLSLTGGHESASAIRYFLMTMAAGAAWPLTFKFFSRLGGGKTNSAEKE